MKKRILASVFLLILVFTLFGCSDNYNEKTSDEFSNYLMNYYEVSEELSGRLSFSSENIKFYNEADVKIEKAEYGTYHIIVTMGDPFNRVENIWAISPDKIKEEMHFLAEAFIDFAKSQNMDNDYYLYIKAYGDLTVHFIYDYEEDILYFPQKYDLYREMYNTFDTISDYEISKTEEGRDWLVQNGFGEIKHGEYEAIIDYDSPQVTIDENGDFHSHNLKWIFN